MTVKAVILVGGPSRGTRFRPLSLNVPKPLFPIAGHPIIYHHIAALTRLPDLSEILIVGFFKDVVFAAFINDVKREFGINVRYLREYQALGTAGGLYHFRDEIIRGNPSHFFVLHADLCSSFPLADMLTFHKNHQGLCTILGTKVARDLAHKYGCLVAKPNSTTGEVMHYVEKPETFVSNLISCGVYIFSTTIAFTEIRRALENRKTSMGVPQGLDDDAGQSPTTVPEGDDSNTVVRLEQDLLRPLAADGKLFVFETKDFWRQIKTAGSSVPANALYLEQKVKLNNAALAKNTPDGPEIVGAVWIDPSAKVDPSAKIGPNVSIGPGCIIGSGVRVRDAIILDNVEVKNNALIVHAVVGWDSKIGNWTRVEGTLPSACNSAVTQNGRKLEGATILGKEVVVADELIIRNCVVLPNKELRNSCHSEILM